MVIFLSQKKMRTKTYHIYLKEDCLFKDLNEREFDVIWGRIYKSYWTDEVTYVEVTENPIEPHEESSY